MITEADFQAALDADPGDSLCRLAFADWLEEQGDPRAAGYRALGESKRMPEKAAWRPGTWLWLWLIPGDHRWDHRQPATIPTPWKKRIVPQPSRFFPSRAEAEDAAALAWANMTAVQRDKAYSLLAGGDVKSVTVSLEGGAS